MPPFEGQTKAKLGNASIRTLTIAVVNERLLIGSGFLHVEHLAPHGENCLKPAVPPLDSGARGGVAWNPARCQISFRIVMSGTRPSASSIS